jgi:hypothetical protein
MRMRVVVVLSIEIIIQSNAVVENISGYTMLRVYVFPSIKCSFTLSNSFWSAYTNTLSGSPHLEEPTYKCPWENTLFGK